MASLLDDEELVSAPPLTDDDHNLEIQELVVDDLHVVDMLGGHADPIQSNEFRRAQDVLYARIFTIKQLNTTQ